MNLYKIILVEMAQVTAIIFICLFKYRLDSAV